jgi:hypothetical protein
MERTHWFAGARSIADIDKIMAELQMARLLLLPPKPLMLDNLCRRQ